MLQQHVKKYFTARLRVHSLSEVLVQIIRWGATPSKTNKHRKQAIAQAILQTSMVFKATWVQDTQSFQKFTILAHNAAMLPN